MSIVIAIFLQDQKKINVFRELFEQLNACVTNAYCT